MRFGEQMAIYHFTCKYVSRAGDADKNAVRSAAYCAGQELSDMNTGATFNYSNKDEVAFSEIQAPANAPEWVADRQRLWSEVEKKEVRYDAKLMSQFEASLPNELDLEQCKALMYDFSSASLVKRGMVSDWSIHWHRHNQHVHVNATTREITGEGFGKKVREWEEKKTLFALRKEWAECVNKHLAMAGFDVRIDHRSFKDQGIDHEPTVHVGPERANNKEVVADRKARNRRTRNRNRIVDADKKADATIKELESKVKQAKEQLEVVVARENKTTLKKRIASSVQKPTTQPTPNTHKKPPQSVSKSTFPAPAGLFGAILNKHFNPNNQTKPSASPRYPIPIKYPKQELILPNGKYIWPDSYETLLSTIDAWELTQSEATRLKLQFWSCCSTKYYTHYANQVTQSKNLNSQILNYFTNQELKEFKQRGLGPEETIERCTKSIQIAMSSLPQLFMRVQKAGTRVSRFNIANMDVRLFLDTWHNKGSIQQQVNHIISTSRPNNAPVEVMNVFYNKTEVSDIEKIETYANTSGWPTTTKKTLLDAAWKQISFARYTEELAKAATLSGLSEKLKSMPDSEIEYMFNSKSNLTSAIKQIEIYCPPSEYEGPAPDQDLGTSNFNPTPGATPADYQQSSNPTFSGFANIPSTPTKKKGSGSPSGPP